MVTHTHTHKILLLLTVMLGIVLINDKSLHASTPTTLDTLPESAIVYDIKTTWDKYPQSGISSGPIKWVIIDQYPGDNSVKLATIYAVGDMIFGHSSSYNSSRVREFLTSEDEFLKSASINMRSKVIPSYGGDVYTLITNFYVYDRTHNNEDRGDSWLNYSSGGTVPSVGRDGRIKMINPSSASLYVRSEILLPGDTKVYPDGTGKYVLFEPLNTKPIITLTNPTTDQTINSTGSIQIKGTVTDPDIQTLTISATINNETKTTIVVSPAVSKPYTLTWEGSEVNNGVYKNIQVTVTDNLHSAMQNYTGKLTVDKIKPTIKIKVE